jgi:hypothetical protein
MLAETVVIAPSLQVHMEIVAQRIPNTPASATIESFAQRSVVRGATRSHIL